LVGYDLGVIDVIIVEKNFREWSRSNNRFEDMTLASRSDGVDRGILGNQMM
jgi:hypothetical protein